MLLSLLCAPRQRNARRVLCSCGLALFGLFPHSPTLAATRCDCSLRARARPPKPSSTLSAAPVHTYVTRLMYNDDGNQHKYLHQKKNRRVRLCARARLSRRRPRRRPRVLQAARSLLSFETDLSRARGPRPPSPALCFQSVFQDCNAAHRVFDRSHSSLAPWMRSL